LQATTDATAALTAAGLDPTRAGSWVDRIGAASGQLEVEAPLPALVRAGRLCAEGWDLLAALPRKGARSETEAVAAGAIMDLRLDLCRRALAYAAEPLYDQLTDGRRRHLRVEALAEQAALRFPGLTPTQAELAAEAKCLQKEKDGLELQQGLLFGALLDCPRAGGHLVETMLRPTPEAEGLLAELRRTGRVDLDCARVRIDGRAGHVEFAHPRYLNAEDDETLPSQEMAVDLLLLHPDVEVGVLRGAPVDHPKHQGRRIFSAGINLTRLYRGGQSYLFYLTRDLGWVNKVYRGIATGEAPAETTGGTHELPWLAAVDRFAVGGGCQLLLVVDFVLAEHGAWFNLPARKEGIIPGCANLRLPRFVGQRTAQEAILFGRTFDVSEPAASGLITEVAESDDMDHRLTARIEGLLESGMVSAAGNRRALRVQAEPLDDFRRYMAAYAREQALCHLSPQLSENLERHWHGAAR
jgi:thioesterase DpgC